MSTYDKNKLLSYLFFSWLRVFFMHCVSFLCISSNMNIDSGNGNMTKCTFIRVKHAVFVVYNIYVLPLESII